MHEIIFSTDDGSILLGGKIVAPLGLCDFKRIAQEYAIGFTEYHPSVNWTTVGIHVNIGRGRFGMNLSYCGSSLEGCWFGWGEGVSALKGYSTTEEELISDKNELTRIIAKILGKAPERRNYNNDVFLYDWGYISTSASLRSTSIALGVSWVPYFS